VYLEQEPGQSGKSQVDHYARRVLKGYTVRGTRPTGDKVTRASAASAAWARGEVLLVAGPWVELVLSLLDRFPDPGVHDEPADLLSQFWQVRMVDRVGGEARVSVF
jgi:predicted phage terminase large subunit-like protein